MKKYFLFFILLLVLANCTTTTKEIIKIADVDAFPTREENQQLGLDLFYYPYFYYLQQEAPGMKEDDLKNITYEVVVEKDKIWFRLTLNNEAIADREKIVAFFKRMVSGQIDRQVSDKKIFEQALALAKENVEQLDMGQYDLFWKKTASTFNSVGTLDQFVSTVIKQRDKIFDSKNGRTLKCKQYFHTLPRAPVYDYYVITFKFSGDDKMFEEIIYHPENNELLISGYKYGSSN